MRVLRLNIAVEKLRLSKPFRISGFVFEEQEVVVVTIDDGLHRGRGEASGVYYLGDTAQSMVAAIEAVRGTIEAGIDRLAAGDSLPDSDRRNSEPPVKTTKRLLRGQTGGLRRSAALLAPRILRARALGATESLSTTAFTAADRRSVPQCAAP